MYQVVEKIGCLVGSSLRCEMPEVTSKRISTLFKIPVSALRAQEREKYSKSIVVKNTQGEVYTVYMCYGQWRVGGYTRPADVDRSTDMQLERLRLKGGTQEGAEQLKLFIEGQ